VHSHNVSDSEYMAGQLAEFGFEVFEDDARRFEADLWLLNSCTVLLTFHFFRTLRS
jgi:threonylcarbamoyladenosine tRNA methylthiotransferase CDKAL1